MGLELQADLDDVEGRDAEAGDEACYAAGDDDLLSGALVEVSMLIIGWGVGVVRRGEEGGGYLIFELLDCRPGRHAPDMDAFASCGKY